MPSPLLNLNLLAAADTEPRRFDASAMRFSSSHQSETAESGEDSGFSGVFQRAVSGADGDISAQVAEGSGLPGDGNLLPDQQDLVPLDAALPAQTEEIDSQSKPMPNVPEQLLAERGMTFLPGSPSLEKAVKSSLQASMGQLAPVAQGIPVSGADGIQASPVQTSGSSFSALTPVVQQAVPEAKVLDRPVNTPPMAIPITATGLPAREPSSKSIENPVAALSKQAIAVPKAAHPGDIVAQEINAEQKRPIQESLGAIVAKQTGVMSAQPKHGRVDAAPSAYHPQPVVNSTVVNGMVVDGSAEAPVVAVSSGTRIPAELPGRIASDIQNAQNHQPATQKSGRMPETAPPAPGLQAATDRNQNAMDGALQNLAAINNAASVVPARMPARELRAMTGGSNDIETPTLAKQPVGSFRDDKQQQALVPKPGVIISAFEGGDTGSIGPARYQSAIEAQQASSWQQPPTMPGNGMALQVDSQGTLVQSPASVHPSSLSSPAASTPVTLASAMPQEIEVPVGHAAWEKSMAKQVLQAGQNQLQTLHIKLNPANLGALEVRISVEAETTSIVFSSHHAVVREAVEGAIPRLREMFTNSGLNLGDVNVGNQSAAEEQGRQSAGRPPAGESSGSDVAGSSEQVADAPVRPASSGDQLLDYYI